MGLLKRFMGEKNEPISESGEKTALMHLTEADFDKVIASSTPTVVDFWAEWCGPCHMIAPAVNELANEFAGRAQIAKVNADENPEILGRYGVMGIPTLIYFKDGKEVDRIIGFTAYGAIKRKLEQVMS